MSTSPSNEGHTSGGTGTNTGASGTANPSRAPAASSKKFACVLCRRRKLKCDGAKPACATCSRLKHHCTYQDDAPKKPSTKRRNIRDLEARLAQVEGKLTQEKAKSAANAAGNPGIDQNASIEQQWTTMGADMDWNPDLDPLDDSNLFPSESWSPDPVSDPLLNGASMLPLGMHESLPPQGLMDELHNHYFCRLNTLMPMIHEARYRASLDLAPHMRPALCLRYAIWAVTSAVIEPYHKYKEIFYQRARMYIEIDELKGQGESFVTIQHAQTWSLLGNYEIRSTAFPRAWLSSGRAVRLCQMMGFDRLDTSQQGLKKTVAPARDWVELEERRRTFWTCFCGDRWASAGTGWAMTIVEEDILTNLPSTEEAFRTGTPEETLPLSSLFTAQGASTLSTFSGVVFMAALFGHNIIHMHRDHGNNRPEDYSNGEFWKRHRKMDNVLTTTAFSLPPHMKLPRGIRDANVILINMNIHSSVICLHQAAALKAEEFMLDHEIVQRSRVRCGVAADEIVNIMRMCSHLDITDMNPWVCFSLYVAAQVFLDGCRRKEDNFDQNRCNLEFVVGALHVIRHKHGIVQAFLAQLELDMNSIGLFESFSKAASTAGPGLLGRPYVLPLGRDKDAGDVELGAISTFAAQRYRTAHNLGHAQASHQSSTGDSDGLSNSATPSDTNDTQTSQSGSGKGQTQSLPTRPSSRPSLQIEALWPCPFVDRSRENVVVGDTARVAMYPRSTEISENPRDVAANMYNEESTSASISQPFYGYQADPKATTSQSAADIEGQLHDFTNFDMGNQEFLNADGFDDFNMGQHNEALSAMFDEAQRQMRQ